MKTHTHSHAECVKMSASARVSQRQQRQKTTSPVHVSTVVSILSQSKHIRGKSHVFALLIATRNTILTHGISIRMQSVCFVFIFNILIGIFVNFSSCLIDRVEFYFNSISNEAISFVEFFSEGNRSYPG